MSTKKTLSSKTAKAAPDEPLYRSSSAALLARIPVATLRVWERRYRVASSRASPSGQRLYNQADINRLALIKQLTQSGHAIGSLAALPLELLQDIAATQGRLPQPAVTGSFASPGAPGLTWRVAVVGAALAQRLTLGQVSRHVSRHLAVATTWADLASLPASQVADVDAVLLQTPSLHDDWLDQLEAAIAMWPRVSIGVLYGHASDSACERLTRAGIAIHRNSLSDMRLGVWLASLANQAAPAAALPARRWDDAQLAVIATLSSQVACECPRHIAELLQLLSSFESYSAECQSRHSADAQLHQYFNQTAGEARVAFETALLKMAALDGLKLP